MAEASDSIAIRTLLEWGLRIAVGCSEPAAIALATAHAAGAARPGERPDPDKVERIELRLHRGVYKNALAVSIPNTGGTRGVRIAAALGAAGDPQRRLRVLETVTPEDLDRARRLVERGGVSAGCLDGSNPHHLVEVRVRAAGEEGQAVIAEGHDCLVHLERNGTALPIDESDSPDGATLPGDVTLADLVNAVDGAALEDLARIDEGVRLNRRMMDAGKTRDGSSPLADAVSSAVEARMRGVSLPVMTSCGSGNQGILVHLSIALLAEQEGVPPDRTKRAIALAHLVSQYSTDRLGVLSPLCGLFAKGGLGAAAGLCYLLGGDGPAVDRSVRLMVAGHAGTMCDGAKPECAIKMAAAVEGALRSARLALVGYPLAADRGLAGTTAEQAIGNLSVVAAGMLDADRALFDLLRAEAEGGEATSDGRGSD